METTQREVQTYKKSVDWPKSVLRIAFGIIWLVDAIFKWQPAFREGYLDVVTSASQGQPNWLMPWFNFWIATITPRVTFFYYSTAIIETLIALALIFGFARKSSYILAMIFSLFIWAIPEGFGGPYSAGSTDVGTGLIYAIVFLALLALNAQPGTSKYSLDYILEKKISWWKKVAEIKL